jgi:hypothetical protein
MCSMSRVRGVQLVVNPGGTQSTQINPRSGFIITHGLSADACVVYVLRILCFKTVMCCDILHYVTFML